MLDIFGKKKREEERKQRLEEIEAERERIDNIAKEAEKKRKAAERKAKKAKVDDTPKAKATAAKEPWVEVLSMDIDEDDPGNGAFELDWNDIFVARLVKAGYQGKSDQDIVDNWFKTVCRNVLMETFEQEQADPETRQATNNKRNLGDGYSEHS